MNTERLWKGLLVLMGIELLAAIYLLRANAGLRAQARQLVQASKAESSPSPALERIALLQQENERLKSNLAEIPELLSKKASLESEAARRQATQADAWSARSNRIQQAIERSRRELGEIHDWMSARLQIERREKVLSRLRERGLPDDRSPEAAAKEYEALRDRLKQIGLAMRKQVELREQWLKSDRSEQTRATFQPQFEASYRDWETALGQLGDDRILYDELPVRTPLQNLPSATPVLRSVVPDLRGRSVTVYLDGSVVFSQ